MQRGGKERRLIGGRVWAEKSREHLREQPGGLRNPIMKKETEQLLGTQDCADEMTLDPCGVYTQESCECALHARGRTWGFLVTFFSHSDCSFSVDSPPTGM